MDTPPRSYRESGVDIDAGNELVRRIGKLAQGANRPEVVAGIGGFAGLCGLPAGLNDPLLVAGTDGVGTKLKIAFATGRHSTVGIDLVAMCANDVAVTGAAPLFFLDYFACGQLEVGVAEAVIAGIVEGCKQAGCALLGGETAELPGFYAAGEYDLAGFCVGVVERSRVIDGSRVQAGDAVIGIASSGLHSNGYSLARQVLIGKPEDLAGPAPGNSSGKSLADELLTPTRIYIKVVQALQAACDVKSLAHITGGGLLENPPRVLPKDLGIRLWLGSWPVPAVFTEIAERAKLDTMEMRRTFNLGLGLLAIVPKDQIQAAKQAVVAAGETGFLVGEVITAGTERMEFV